MNRSLLLLAAVVLVAVVGITFALKRPNVHRPACVIDECPSELRADSSGSAFVYRVASRVTVILDERTDPREHLSCAPEGIVGVVSDVQAVEPPLYAVRLEMQKAGSCVLANDDFSATIDVKDAD